MQTITDQDPAMSVLFHLVNQDDLPDSDDAFVKSVNNFYLKHGKISVKQLEILKKIATKNGHSWIWD